MRNALAPCKLRFNPIQPSSSSKTTEHKVWRGRRASAPFAAADGGPRASALAASRGLYRRHWLEWVVWFPVQA